MSDYRNNDSRPSRGYAKRRPSSPNRSKKKGPESNLKAADLQQQAQAREITNYVSDRSFADFPIHDKLKGALAHKGYEKPTEIQDRSIESLLANRDLLGIAQTGTGKTAAFLIPIIDKQLRDTRSEAILVLAPTRELAVQIEEEYRSLSRGMSFQSSCFIGGTNINRDVDRARRKPDVVVGTPGRLLDLSDRGALDFRDFKVLVLDEFDRMLDMGFEKDVNRITSAMRNRKHTMLFSATLDKTQRAQIDRLLTNAVEVKVSSGEASNDHVEQDIIKVAEGDDKFQMLLDLIDNPEFEKVLVFAETKRWVSKVRIKLSKAGIKADEIHGNKTQNYRQNALKAFKSGKIKVLVATDVAARGLDVEDVSHVINYQVPKTMDSYIHRVGRTGRAGKRGKAYTFIQD